MSFMDLIKIYDMHGGIILILAVRGIALTSGEERITLSSILFSPPCNPLLKSNELKEQHHYY